MLQKSHTHDYLLGLWRYNDDIQLSISSCSSNIIEGSILLKDLNNNNLNHDFTGIFTENEGAISFIGYTSPNCIESDDNIVFSVNYGSQFENIFQLTLLRYSQYNEKDVKKYAIDMVKTGTEQLLVS